MIPGIVAGRPVQGLWSPAKLIAPPGFWVDDNSVVTATSPPLIDSWNDRSSNARNATASGSNRPSLGSSPWRVEYAAGRRSDIDNSGPLFRAVTSGWLFGVWRRTSADESNISRPVVAWGTNADAVRLGLFAGENVTGAANRIGMGGRRADGDSYRFFGASSAHVSGDWVMALGLVDYSANTVDIWINGALDNSHTSAFTGSGPTSNTNSLRARVASNSAMSSLPSLSGEIRCVMAGAVLPDSDEVDKIFGWAAWQFGLESNLPVGHPYKDAPPYV